MSLKYKKKKKIYPEFYAQKISFKNEDEIRTFSEKQNGENLPADLQPKIFKEVFPAGGIYQTET